MKWQDLEKKVRTIASYKWDTPSNPETINGVKKRFGDLGTGHANRLLIWRKGFLAPLKMGLY